MPKSGTVVGVIALVVCGCRGEPEPTSPAEAQTEAVATRAAVTQAAMTQPAGTQPEFDLNTYEGVVAHLVSILDEESKALLLKTAKDDLIQFHHGWGMGIRNGYGLWHNRALRRSCAKQAGHDGDMHADSASGIIMEGVWEALRKDSPQTQP